MKNVAKYNLWVAPVVALGGIYLGSNILVIVGFINWTIGVWND